MRKRIFNKNHKGIAMITIMITISFLAIIATTLLYISATNYAMKVSNSLGKENYYETDGILVKTTTSIRNSTMKQSNPLSAIDTLKTAPADSTYSVLKVAQLVYPSATGGNTSATAYIPSMIAGKSDKITFKSTNNTIDVTTGVTPGVTTYKFNDIEIIQTSAEGYTNSVKTDLVFDIYEKVTPGGAAGGVGNMSMLLDSPLSSSAAKFKCMTMTGNAFFADYEENGDVFDGEVYVSPGDGGLVMSNESRLNLKGENNVIYGDLHLSGNASLAVYGNLTVYGDILVEDNATLIISEGGHLYQLKSDVLPGKIEASKFEVPAGNLYPPTLVPEEITKENFKNFATTIGVNLSVNVSGDYGLINKIFAEMSEFGGDRVIDLTSSEVTTYDGITGLTKNNPDIGRGYFMNDSIYGMDKFGVAFFPNGVNTSSLNGGYDHRLMISLNQADIIMQQSNPYTTWISKYPVSVKEAHCITLSKLGTDQFNYMTASKGDAESAAYDNNSNPFNHVRFKFDGYSEYNGAFGDFFVADCNAYVDQMFGYSMPGGGVSSKSYASAVNFTNYSRDF